MFLFLLKVIASQVRVADQHQISIRALGAVYAAFKMDDVDVPVNQTDLSNFRQLLLGESFSLFKPRFFDFALDAWSYEIEGGAAFVLGRIESDKQESPALSRRILHASVDGYATESGLAGDSAWTLTPRSLGALLTRQVSTVVAIGRVSDGSGPAHLISKHVGLIAARVVMLLNLWLIVCCDHPALMAMLGFPKFFNVGLFCAQLPIYHDCVPEWFGAFKICRCQIFQDFSAHGLWCATSGLLKRLHKSFSCWSENDGAEFVEMCKRAGVSVTGSGQKTKFGCKNNVVQTCFSSLKSIFLVSVNNLLCGSCKDTSNCAIIKQILFDFQYLCEKLRSQEVASPTECLTAKDAALRLISGWTTQFSGFKSKRVVPFYVGQLAYAWAHMARCRMLGIGPATVSQIYVEAMNDKIRGVTFCEAGGRVCKDSADTMQADNAAPEKPLQSFLKKQKLEIARTLSSEGLTASSLTQNDFGSDSTLVVGFIVELLVLSSNIIEKNVKGGQEQEAAARGVPAPRNFPNWKERGIDCSSECSLERSR